MRVIFTSFLLLFSFCGFSQACPPPGLHCTQKKQGLTGQASNLNSIPATDTTKPVIVRLRCQATITNADPLLVVDGLPVELAKLKEINPSDIDEIRLLKDISTTTIYSCRPGSGVIVIITKKSKQRQFVVKDFSDGRGVEGSTVTFISKNDTLMFAADKNGSIETDRLKPGTEYAVSVTSIGYKPFTGTFNTKNKTAEFFLQQEFVINKPVVVVGYPVIRCGTITGSQIRVIGCGPDDNPTTTIAYHTGTEKNITAAGFSFYPNPLQRGQSFTIEYQSKDDRRLSVNIIGMDGRKVAVYPWKVTRGPNRTMITTHAGLAAGTYIVQLMSDISSNAAAGKLLIR